MNGWYNLSRSHFQSCGVLPITDVEANRANRWPKLTSTTLQQPADLPPTMSSITTNSHDTEDNAAAAHYFWPRIFRASKPQLLEDPRRHQTPYSLHSQPTPFDLDWFSFRAKCVGSLLPPSDRQRTVWKLVYWPRSEIRQCILQKYRWTYRRLEVQHTQTEHAPSGADWTA